MKIKEVLDKKLAEIKVSEDDEARIIAYARDFVGMLNSQLKQFNARAVLGGSFAKGTAVKKKMYDVDIFAAFTLPDEVIKQKSEVKRILAVMDLDFHKKISDNTGKALKLIGAKPVRLPGSRDYFNVKVVEKDITFRVEVVPVFDIKKAKEYFNVTDVSPLHVRYVMKKTKGKKGLADEIRIAKAFCYGQDCYGAENYIRGLSGYCLEVLVIHYGSFLGLAKAAAKWAGKKRIILDPAKHYWSEKGLLKALNEAKLAVPLVVVDPVQKDRNIAAALSREKLEVFSKACKDFLKKPSMSFFEKKEISEEKIVKSAKKARKSLFKVEAVSVKKKEDISGAKLLKLHKVLKIELGKESYKFKDFWDFEGTRARSYFLIDKVPKEFIQLGPPLVAKQHVKQFKKKWRNAKVKGKRLIGKRKVRDVKKVLDIDKYKRRCMDIDSFKIIKLN